MYKSLDHFDFDHRLLYVRNIFIFSLLFLIVGMVYFQLARADEYVRLASNNRLRVIRLISPRGNIYDASGVPLAVNVRTFDIKAYPMDLMSDAAFESTADLFTRHGIPMTSPDLREHVNNQYVVPFRAVSIASNLTIAQVSDLVMDPEFSNSLFLSSVWRRIYPAGALTAHVVGHVGEITRDELEYQRDMYYQAGDIIGKGGIESMYEEYLRGVIGEQVVEVDARGRMLRNINYSDPQKGLDINLTLDLAAQREGFRLMDGRRGALVVMDANDGAVRVFVSSPSYDPNPLTWGISSREWSALLNDPDKPMMNRVTGGAYPPGSVFKSVPAAGILMERVAGAGERVMCPGFFRIGDPERTFRCWLRSGHGRRDLIGAISDSCDVYFYEKSITLGIDRMIEWGREFGVGERTGIDIPGEIRGNIAGRDWKRSRIGEPWFHGDTVNYSIGQGFLLMTPIQIARMYAPIANGGRLVVPHFNADKKTEGPMVRVSSANMDIIRRGMEEVMRSGTGRRLREFGVDMAGKTGTSENPHGEPHAVFVGYAPLRNPRYVAAVLIEEGGGGGAVAGPVVAQMLAYLLQQGT